jgi:hypothetical protein
MANKWLQHLARFRQQNKHLSARQMMSAARKTYSGGNAESNGVAASVSGSSANSNSRTISTDSQFAAVGGRRSRKGGCGSAYNTNHNPAPVGGRRKSRRRSSSSSSSSRRRSSSSSSSSRRRSSRRR